MFSGLMPLPHESFATFCPHYVGCLFTFLVLPLEILKFLSVYILIICLIYFPFFKKHNSIPCGIFVNLTS